MNTPRNIVYIAPAMYLSASSASRTLRFSLIVSATLHVLAVAALIFLKSGSKLERPPAYRVELIGAAGMKRQMGVVAEQAPVQTAPTNAPAPAAAERPVETPKPVPVKNVKAKPVPKPTQATPNVSKTKTATGKTETKPAEKTPSPAAGSGNKTGRGTDVTNMVAYGIEFPYPGYLNQIARQVTLRFERPAGNLLVPLVRFLIHRDGSITGIEVVTSSGSGALDREAIGAVEAAGTSRAIGPLPAGFPDDVLPVFFTFAPAKSPAPTQ